MSTKLFGFHSWDNPFSILEFFGSMFFFTSTFTLMFIIWTLLKEYKKWYQERKKMFNLASKLPGPPALPIIGNALIFAGDHEEALDRVRDVTSKYESPMRFWLGPKLMVSLDKPRDYEVILNSSNANNKSSLYKFLEPFMGRGLITNSGPTHHSHRKAIMPMLSKKALSEYVKHMDHHCRIFTEILEEKLDSEEFDVLPFTTYVTLDIMYDTILGLPHCSQKHEDRTLAYWIGVMHEISHLRMIKAWLHPDWIFSLTNFSKKQKEGHAAIYNIINDAVALKKKEHNALKSGEIVSDRPRLMLLEQLIDHVDKTNLMSDDEISEEILTAFTASQDTTGYIGAFALLNLAIHQDIQDKVRDEIREVVGDNIVEVDHLSKLKYTELVVKETLRLYPVASMIVRETTGDINLETCTLPKGCTVVMHPFVTHRSEKYWSEPEKFIPERFLPENSSKRHPCTYIPFSSGFRGCIGRKYAHMCLKVMIVHVIRKFKLRSSKKLENLRLKTDIVVRSRDGYMISLTRV